VREVHSWTERRLRDLPWTEARWQFQAPHGMVMALNALPQERAQPLARQFPDLARDALFRDCLDVARSMARGLPPGSDLLPVSPPR